LFIYELRTKFYEQHLLGSKKGKIPDFPSDVSYNIQFQYNEMFKTVYKFDIDRYLYYELYLAGRSQSKTAWDVLV
jgi:hypothetical protein